MRFAFCLLVPFSVWAVVASCSRSIASGPPPPLLFHLSPAIKPYSETLPHGRFFETRTRVILPRGTSWRAFLCSDPRCRAPIRTDDRLVLQSRCTDGVVRRLVYDFGHANGSGVSALPPPDITGVLRSGLVELHLSLYDLYPPLYSSSPYYLVVRPRRPAPKLAVLAPATSTALPTPSTVQRQGHSSHRGGGRGEIELLLQGIELCALIVVALLLAQGFMRSQLHGNFRQGYHKPPS